MENSRIIILDEGTVHKIAAGEVVERPTSIVKELVENSIDAGATKIEIEVKKGGKSLIKIRDDGCGMTETEAKLSLQRHSTSKIKNSDDLFSIKTLGFRGEALPSICAVSKMELITKGIMETVHGYRIKCEGGKMVEKGAAGCPPGTTVMVEDLFFNTPARLKFLKGDKTELANIIDLVSKFIISYPRVSFRLKQEDNEILNSSGKAELLEAISAVYGVEIAKDLLSLSYLDSSLRIHGFTSNPQMTRSNRNSESFFVNGRFVKNILLSKALEEGYKNTIPGNRFPISIIFIEIDPKNIDVNVHPAKRDIKFSNSFQITQALAEVISDTILSTNTVTEVRDTIAYPVSGGVPAGSPSSVRLGQTTAGGQEKLEFGNLAQPVTVEAETEPLLALQIGNSYIVVAEKEGFAVIDQHAAHERILFEKLKKKTDEFSQKMLVPETIEMTASQTALLEVNIKYLQTLGFEIEPFGKNTFMVRAIPLILSRGSAKDVLFAILSEFENADRSLKFEEIEDRIHKLLACHGAIKAGDKLTAGEIKKLIEDAKNTPYYLTCPHGRPAFVNITEKDLRKMFGRP